MPDLSNSITQSYLSHFDALPLDKQVHFATRMYAWTGESRYADLLTRTRPLLLPDENPLLTLTRIRDGELFELRGGNKSAAAKRAPYFDTYPSLRLDCRLLYWANILTGYYGVDCTEATQELLPPEHVARQVEAVGADTPAIAMLSTFAVNFLYLAAHQRGDTLPDPTVFLRIAQSEYDFSDPTDTLLCAYLLTHCVINESLFYTRSIPAERRDTYRDILHWLDEQLAGTPQDLRLDNIFEFVVCCKLVGYEPNHIRLPEPSNLQVSEERAFIVDPRSNATDMAHSEHRSVLYLMAANEGRL